MSEMPFSGEDREDLELQVRAVAATPDPDESRLRVVISTNRGDIPGLLHPCEGEPGAAILVSGALGGLDGPAGGLYADLATGLASRSLTSLRLHYRQPGEFEECVMDVLAGISFLKALGARRIALVGHSFGAAVAIKAGELSPPEPGSGEPLVTAVAALSSQVYGTRSVEKLAPRALLLVHGTADDILSAEASEDIHSRAREPKRLVLYPGAGHALLECRDELYELLAAWLVEHVGPRPDQA